LLESRNLQIKEISFFPEEFVKFTLTESLALLNLKLKWKKIEFARYVYTISDDEQFYMVANLSLVHIENR